MGILLDVFIQGGLRASRSRPGYKEQVGSLNFTVSLDADKNWYLQKPFPANFRLITTEGRGKWYKDVAGSFVLQDAAGEETVLELRSVNLCRGPAFCWPRKGNRGAVFFDGQGRWTPSDRPLPKSWIGIMVKGGAGAVVSGEGAFGAVLSLWGGAKNGCSFFSKTGRLGAVAGFSGGLALVYATGFSSANDFEGFTSDGWDFAFAFGTKVSGLVNGKWAKLVNAADKFDGGVELVESIVQGANPKYQALRTELPGIAKSISQGFLIDPDQKTLTVVDVPLAGGGAEVGIYYGWSSTNLLSAW